MTIEMRNSLIQFLKEKSASDINRTTYLVCNLEDKPRKLKISLVFIKDWHSLIADECSYLPIEDKGAVFTFPSFWLSIPIDLSIPFLTNTIDDYYRDELHIYDETINNGGTGTNNPNNTPNSSGLNCPYR